MHSHDSTMTNAFIALLTSKKLLIPVIATALVALTVTTVIYAQSSGTRYVPLPQASSGHFHHDIYSPSMEVDVAGVDVYNTLATAIFQNPYSWRAGRFVYGFHLRVNSQSENPTVKFYLSSSGTWHLWSGDNIYSGPVLPDVGAYETNYLAVQLSGQYATMFVNGEKLADADDNTRFHLGPNTAKGDVWIVNSPFFGSAQHGATTHYDMFQVFTPSNSPSGTDLDQPHPDEWTPAKADLPSGTHKTVEGHSLNTEDRKRLQFEE